MAPTSSLSHQRNNRLSVGVKQQQYVWVSHDLIESSLSQTKKLRIRKRNRSFDDWGWCRAAVVSSDRARNNSHANGRMAMQVTIADELFAPADMDGTPLNIAYNNNTTDNPLVFQCNDWWKQDDPQAPEDLTELEQLHEPAVVYCLHHRYQKDVIYTYTGKILLALNPFRPLELYGEEVMQRYWQAGRLVKDRKPPPHIYAIAEDAYRSAVNPLLVTTSATATSSSIRQDDQSILVSGESGAGKTVTTKIILQYFAVLSQQSDPTVIGIESQVLESNPILESFGNARTVRNDNSSRFGKLMELLFDRKGCLLSASIQTYLLEKVRLLSQSPGERNYHIFYELLVGLTHRESRQLRLSSRGPKDFRMTCASGTFDRRDGIQDRDTYAQLIEALDTVGFTREEQMDLFTVVSALLYTSNLTFVEESADASILDATNASLEAALELLGVDAEVLNAALCTCAIEARGETLYKHLPIDRAEKAVDALIKATYSALFNHIVKKINSFMTKVERDDVSSPRGPSTASIAVLDIFGFESFEQNSFEQLCINFCNEALQQQFNKFVFKLEQEEYRKEGIDWAFITFPDNQDVLDLIEKRHDGILSILDEQCRLPRCTDATFAASVYQKCSSHKRLESSKSMQARLSFAIHHYAGLVEYDSDCFLEKNKDELSKETTMLLRSSGLPFLVQLGRDLSASATSPPSTPSQRKGSGRQTPRAQSSSSLKRESVGSQFCNQLKQLRTRIDATTPHYVRCLKPNDELLPHSCNALVLADQLRCAGVIEAIRVSRVGFPHRYSHDNFVQRYGLLEPRELNKQQALGSSSKYVCDVLVEILNRKITEMFDEESASQLLGANVDELVHGIQMGKSKVFLRRMANEALEFLRRKFVEKSAVRIQAKVRMFLTRSNYEIALYAVSLMQRFVRQIGNRKIIRELRIENSACILQRFFRCCKSRRELRAAVAIAIWCQSAARGAIARQYCAYLFLDQKAASIQKAWRYYSKSCFGSFTRFRRAFITLQNLFRSRKARRVLWKLRSEARDLARIAAERDKFKEESRRLRKELEKALVSPSKPTPQIINPDVGKLRAEVQDLQDELEKAHRMSSPSQSIEARKQGIVEELERKEEELRNLRREIAVLRSRDDRSTSIKSMLIETRQSANTSLGSASNHLRGSPARSDVSLLDDEDEPVADDVSSLTSVVRQETVDDDLRLLHSAVRQKSFRHLDHVLNKTSEACVLVNQGDRYGRTAMHLAVLSLDVQIVAKLIGHGAVVNTQDDDGETPLHLAEDSTMTRYLLEQAMANPNIPNVDGICALHLAVQRRDVSSVEALAANKANVNNADNIRWFTALHLIALPAGTAVSDTVVVESRCMIARVLTRFQEGQSQPDLNYQDSEGNSPLHYGVQLDASDTCELITIFLEKNANANLRNSRDQVPLHLLCHNSSLRQNHAAIFRRTINALLIHGADPSAQSMTGCTPLHLCLFHRDIETAIQLVRGGAQLHCVWKKPKKWKAFWEEKERGVVALDMVAGDDTSRLLSAVSVLQKPAPSRNRCMECKSTLRSFSRTVHCGHCGRLLCSKCSGSCLPAEFFPKSFKLEDPTWACAICEKVLMSQKEIMSNGTHPTSSYGDDDDDDCYSC